MLALLLLLLALNLSSTTPLPVPNGNTTIILFGRELPESLNMAQYRTLQDIIWSCLVTIFACTWVAVHPNLPGPYDSGLTKLKRKVTMMIYGIFAPELLTMWAMKQYFEAQKIANEFNKTEQSPWWMTFKDSVKRWLWGPPHQNKSREWTVTHGFFLQMGGFMLCDGETPISVLEFRRLKTLVEEGNVDLPRVTEDEISDKSKGDFLTKLFVVVQTSWFAFQCLARWALDLPVTELEVVTLAFAMLNIVTYGLWWNKPLNAVVAIPVPIKSGTENEPPPQIDEEESWLVLKVREALKGRWWMFSIPRRLSEAFLRPIGKLAQVSESHLRPGSLRVPMFYVGRYSWRPIALVGHSGRSKGDIPTLLIGFAFGALHLIPWSSSSFPSTTERWLWRLSALVITAEPICILLLPPLSTALGVITHCDSCSSGPYLFLGRRILILAMILSLLSIPLYLLARFVLLVLSFTTLRNLPQGAYAKIQWTTFLPNI